MKINVLIFGLPGSGKTTLAKQLYSKIDAAWFNADKVREQYNDWDFTIEGRKRQVERMVNLCNGIDKNCIADFVAPTNEIRKIFNADVTIWMNTITEGRFEDTNKIFEKPTNVDIEVKSFDYDISSIINIIKEKYNV